MAYVLDTSAWIEYFKDSERTEFLDDIIENELVFTPSIVLCELSSNFFFTNKKIDKLEWKILINFVKTKTELVPINVEIASNTGLIKVKKRKKHKNIGLSDCIIIATAEWLNARIVTTDPHILDEPNVIKI